MMAQPSSRFITIDDLTDSDEIEIEAAKDASSVAFRKGTFEFVLKPDEFSELICACISVDKFMGRVNNRSKAN